MPRHGRQDKGLAVPNYRIMDENTKTFKLWNRFISAFISRASELAYIEGAQGTARLLACLHDFIRYMQQEAEWAPLDDELKAVVNYVTLCRLRESARGLTLPEENSFFVRRMMLVDAVMQVLTLDSPTDEPDKDLEIRVDVVNHGGNKRLILTVEKTLSSGKEKLKRQWDL